MTIPCSTYDSISFFLRNLPPHVIFFFFFFFFFEGPKDAAGYHDCLNFSSHVTQMAKLDIDASTAPPLLPQANGYSKNKS